MTDAATPQEPATTPPDAPRFICAHATHPQADLALSLIWAQLVPQGVETMGATLGWCYLTEHLAPQAEAIIKGLKERLPGVAWVGAIGHGVLSTGVEYIDEPAVAVMVSTMPNDDFRVYSGRQPLPPLRPGADFVPHVAQVHADASTMEAQDLLEELAQRTTTGYLFGGMSSTEGRQIHLALDPLAAHGTRNQGVWTGGLSGVAFTDRVHLVSRLTQGCQSVGPTRRITSADRNVIYELDGEPALSCLLKDLQLPVTTALSVLQRDALPKVRNTLVGLTDQGSDMVDHDHILGSDTRVRHIVGLDPHRQAVAIGDEAREDMWLSFCHRNRDAARRDLVRICAEIREEFDPADGPSRPIAGAVYISCTGRGGNYFGSPHGEMQIIQHALGDVPIVGMLASGEIARNHLFGYTGVLTACG